VLVNTTRLLRHPSLPSAAYVPEAATTTAYINVAGPGIVTTPSRILLGNRDEVAALSAEPGCAQCLPGTVPLPESAGHCDIELLPALPPAWSAGRVTGLRTRCGVEVVELSWRSGRLAAVLLRWALPHIPPAPVSISYRLGRLRAAADNTSGFGLEHPTNDPGVRDSLPTAQPTHEWHTEYSKQEDPPCPIVFHLATAP
jgi:hypothetical protein